jgi:ParB family chromosome partitioning protein
MPAKKRESSGKKPAGKKTRRRRGVSIKAVSLAAAELGIDRPEGPLAEVAEAVRGDGGAVLGAYREPLGGHALLLVSLPIEKVGPTAFQRDLSEAHLRKLARAMDKTRRFLDPVIVVRQDDRYLAPNGHHRLTVMKELGARAIVGLLVPEPEVAYQILALNIEKAHNLRERALEVVRMYQDLAGSSRKESDFELEFEEPALVTLGFCYQERGRFAGGAYHPTLRKVDTWIEKKMGDCLPERERRAGLLLGLDDAVTETVNRLKQKGLVNPYLRSFVVARINPLPFMKGAVPDLDWLVAQMTKRARSFNVDRIGPEDLARSRGFVGDEAGESEG